LIQSASITQGGDVEVTYRVPSDPAASGSGASEYPLTVHFYAAGPSGEQGRTYLGKDTYSNTSSDDDYDGCGSPPCNVTTPTFTPQASVSESDVIVATATDDDGNTSEFSTTNQQLPVELARFEARPSGERSVRLSWQTASETGNAGFRVQHRRPPEQSGRAWAKAGFVESAASGGTTTEAQSYRFTAADLDVGTHQFRLLQVDLDGETHVQETVTVELTMQQALRLEGPAPNPVSGRATVAFAVKEKQETTLRLYNTLGQQVQTVYRGVSPAGEQQTAQLNAGGLASGVYFLRLRADGRTATRRVTVVR
jgi:hypothetical protein